MQTHLPEVYIYLFMVLSRDALLEFYNQYHTIKTHQCGYIQVESILTNESVSFILTEEICHRW